MKPLAQIYWFALLLKLIVAAALPLTNDEAYYWVWSQHLQLSYYDHPPFVAWLYWVGDHVRFFPGSVRWPGVLLGHAGLAIWLNLLKPYLNDRQRLYWLLLALLSPLVGGSAIVLTPDLPLMFFYALALAVFLRWRAHPDWRLSLVFGATLGLGFSSKYMMVLFGLSLAPLLVFQPEVRRAVIRNALTLAVGFAAGSLPVWLWNLLHDFASIKFQAAHGLGQNEWKPFWTYEYVLLQAGLIFPVVLYWALRARGRMPFVFHLLAWTPLVFFFFTTFRGYVEGNWPIAAYPAIFALAVSWIPENARSLRATLALWATLFVTLGLVVAVQPTWARKAKTKEFRGFDALISASAGYSPLFTRSYQMAAKLSFETGRPIHKLRGMNRTDFYDFLPESEPPPGVYFVAVEKGDRLSKTYLDRGHKIAERIPVDDVFEIWRIEAP